MESQDSPVLYAPFRDTARMLAADVAAGHITQELAEQALGLRPGERLARTGVVIGSGSDLDIPRFGADETDLDVAVTE